MSALDVEPATYTIKHTPMFAVPDVMRQGALMGCVRRMEALGRGDPGNYASKHHTEWSTDIESCIAENGFSRHIGAYWSGGAREPGKPLPRYDVAHYQVRHTHLLTGRLLIKKTDNPEDLFVLIVGRAPYHWIVGTMQAKFARREEWWNPPWMELDSSNPPWAVPQEYLVPWVPL